MHEKRLSSYRELNAEFLNKRLKQFFYGVAYVKNKPTPRFTDSHRKESGNYSTKQKASQNWRRNLPFLFGDIIKEDDIYWELFLSLLHIMDIVFSIKTNDDFADMLDHHICSYIFDLLNKLFPDINLINKAHHLVHYSAMIRNSGPPVRYWCMRF